MIKKTNKPAKKERPKELSFRQHKFVQEYIRLMNEADINIKNKDNDLNMRFGTRAAITAGYSERSAHSTANKLLKMPQVKELIKDELELILGPNRDVIRRKMVERLDILAFSDISNFIDENNVPLPKSQWPKGASAAVSEVTVTHTPEGVKHQLKLKDNYKALTLISKYFHLIDDAPKKIEVDVNVITLDDIKARIRNCTEDKEN